MLSNVNSWVSGVLKATLVFRSLNAMGFMNEFILPYIVRVPLKRSFIACLGLGLVKFVEIQYKGLKEMNVLT